MLDTLYQYYSMPNRQVGTYCGYGMENVLFKISCFHVSMADGHRGRATRKPQDPGRPALKPPKTPTRVEVT